MSEIATVTVVRREVPPAGVIGNRKSGGLASPAAASSAVAVCDVPPVTVSWTASSTSRSARSAVADASSSNRRSVSSSGA